MYIIWQLSKQYLFFCFWWNESYKSSHKKNQKMLVFSLFLLVASQDDEPGTYFSSIRSAHPICHLTCCGSSNLENLTYFGPEIFILGTKPFSMSDFSKFLKVLLKFFFRHQMAPFSYHSMNKNDPLNLIYKIP